MAEAHALLARSPLRGSVVGSRLFFSTPVHEEVGMKRKGHRTIPDFSKKHAATPHTPAAKMKMDPPPTPSVRAPAKPQATSVKSGQRGR